MCTSAPWRRVGALLALLIIPLLLAIPAPTQAATGLATLVKDINRAPGSTPGMNAPSNPRDLTAFGGRIFFMAGDGEAGCPYERDLTQPGRFGCEPHISNGSAAGTMRLADTLPGPDSPIYNLDASDTSRYLGVTRVVVGRKLFFTAPIPGTLWVTEGTPASTKKIWQFRRGYWPLPLYTAGGLVYAYDGLGLVVSDGTRAGTRRIGDFSVIGWGQNVVVMGDRIFFTADDGVHGAELWVSDGSPFGTKIVADINPGKASALDDTGMLGPNGGPWLLGDEIVFLADDGEHGVELWRSGGAPGSTELLHDLTPGPASTPVMTVQLVGRYLYLITGEGGDPRQLWVTVGRHTTTSLLTFEQGAPYTLYEARGRLFFATSTGSPGGNYELQLWMSGLWSEPPTVVATIPGPLWEPNDGFDGELLGVVGDQLLIRVNRYTGNSNSERAWLWALDLKSGAVTELTTLPTNRHGLYARETLVAGDKLYFAGYDEGAGLELWVSDGTPAGTRRLQDINPGPGDSNPRDLTLVGNRLFFSADDGRRGEELWQLREVATAFPSTNVRDRFNRPDGRLGGAWRGSTSGYRISHKQLEVVQGGPIFWPNVFGANQEVFITFKNLTGASQVLMLKVQGELEDPLDQRSYIVVEYSHGDGFARDLRLAVCLPREGCPTLAVWPNFVLHDGDQLGARARADGNVSVYRNGVEVLRGDAGRPFAGRSGRIGLWMQVSYFNMLDNFGGGTLNR